MPDCRLPVAIWIRERGINRVEGVFEEWVRHRGRLSIGCDDIEGLQGDDFGRRDRVSRPIPVWRTQVLSYGNPTLCIRLVRARNLESVLLQYLLDHVIGISSKCERHKIVN